MWIRTPEDRWNGEDRIMERSHSWQVSNYTARQKIPAFHPEEK